MGFLFNHRSIYGPLGAKLIVMNQSEIKQSLALAENYFHSGRYELAETLLRKIVNLEGDNSKANELLAYIYGNQGNVNLSFKFLELACGQDSCSPEVLYYLGSAQLERALFSEAIYSFKRSLEKGGDFFEALHDLGTAYAHLGELEISLQYYQKCLKLRNDSHQLLFNIARVLEDMMRYDEALAHYDSALSLRPNYVDAWINKGVILVGLLRFDEALKHYDEAIRLDFNNYQPYFNKANTLNKLKRYEEALVEYDRAISLRPNYAEAFSNKSVTLNKLKQHSLALELCNSALSLSPDHPEALVNKGISLQALRRYEEALMYFDRALSLSPDHVEALANKGISLQALGHYDQALINFYKAFYLNPDMDWIYGDLFFTKMKICSWDNFYECLEKLRKKILLDKKPSNPFLTLAVSNDSFLHKYTAEGYVANRFPYNSSLGEIHKVKKPNKLRIGYFSADFRNHAMAFLTAELFELHDKTRFEIIAFSFVADDKSQMNVRLNQSFNQFIDVSSRSDFEIAQLARQLEIDIAIDLMGHTQDSRTGIFSYRVAPIQLSYIGYLGTLGANYIDYLVADRVLVPRGSEQFYSEKMVFLPSYQVNDRKRIISTKQFSREELGLPRDEFIFCCFNNNYKILPKTFDSWIQILKAVTKSVLYLYAENPWAMENLKKEAESRGINSDRLVFAKVAPYAEYLARYKVCDLFLDTFPYNAGTTASDALWAGLPVLTLQGQSFASRVASSLLTAIDLPELITTSQREYEDLAIDLAKNPHKLANLKKKLATNRNSKPLFDTPLFTKKLEEAYVQIYERYHQDLPPDHISIQ